MFKIIYFCWSANERLSVRILFYSIVFIILSGLRLSLFGNAATTGLLYQHQMIGDGDCGEIGEMKIGRGNRSPSQIPHD
jgi:hypothetical protein